MNKILIILSLVLLNACGLSQEEKENVAAVTCSIMSETRNMDAAIRVEKMNDAREKIGGEPFLRGDDAIIEAFEWGLCQELVLDDSYNEILQPLKDAKRERERIAEEKQAEEQRIAREKQAEERRIAREKRAEERRIAREKRAEENRIAEEKQRIADSKPTVKEEFYSNGKLKSRINCQPKSDSGKRRCLAESYLENGQLAESKGTLKDGEQDGLWEFYHENGQLEIRRNYKDGKQNGLTERYYENGQLHIKVNLKDGKIDGLYEKYYEDGELMVVFCYKNDKPVDRSYCEK